MSLDLKYAQNIMHKLEKLQPERLIEVEDFIDFLRMRQEKSSLSSLSLELSSSVLTKIWDNPEDAAYDSL